MQQKLIMTCSTSLPSPPTATSFLKLYQLKSPWFAPGGRVWCFLLLWRLRLTWWKQLWWDNYVACKITNYCTHHFCHCHAYWYIYIFKSRNSTVLNLYHFAPHEFFITAFWFRTFIHTCSCFSATSKHKTVRSWSFVGACGYVTFWIFYTIHIRILICTL